MKNTSALLNSALPKRIKRKSRVLIINSRTLWLSYLRTTFDRESGKLVIVTGADSTHYKSVCQFLSSLYRYEKSISSIVYDLGLLDTERKDIASRFTKAELRKFDYSKYPAHLNISINAGEYAWKPVILHDALNEFRCCVCWMDAGNVVTSRLIQLRKATVAIGMYSPRSSGCISDWTHPETLKYLKTPEHLLSKPNLNGACISVSYRNAKARELVRQLKEYALIKDCIAPKGSSRKNHRQDQAILSVVSHQSGITKYMPREKLGFKIHQDID